jgi:hypothetical protein
MRWCRETTWGVRGRDAFREGSTSAVMKRGRAEGQHSGRREASPRTNSAASGKTTFRPEDRECARGESAEAGASE